MTTYLKRNGRSIPAKEFLRLKREDEAKATKASAPVEIKAVEPVQEVVQVETPQVDIKALREEYKQIIGKKCFPGWSIEQIQEKINQFNKQ